MNERAPRHRTRARTRHLGCLVALALLVPLGLACQPRTSTSGASAGGSASLAYSWWGGDSRTKLQNEVVDQFEKKHTGITFKVQTAGDTDSYVDRLAVQASGRNLPDLFQMQDRFLRQFALGDSMRPLDEFVEDGTINVADVPPEVLAAGKYDGEQLMIGTSFSFRGLYYDGKAFQAAGVEAPTPATTWDELATKVRALVASGLPPKVYATLNLCGSDIAFYSYLRGNGVQPFDGDELGFDKDSVVDWLTYWQKLQQAKALPPPALQTEQQGGTTEDSMFAKKMVLLDVAPANQYETIRAANPDAEVTGVPAGPKGPGNYFIVSGQSISARTSHAKEAAQFINFFLNDIQAAQTYKADNGVPASAKAREAVAQSLQLRQFALYDEIKDQVTQMAPPPPGSADLPAALGRSCDELAFGRMDVDRAADQFLAAAKDAIE
ncbi:ABC transporter substrate-binding protein [Actinopolymorpha pittospori]